MAKENVHVPMIPKVTMSNGVAMRRHSAGIASSGNDEKKIVPHYLRASTGSCHDFCKYGRRRVEEAQDKLSVIKRAGRRSLSQRSENSIGEIMISVAKPRASIDSYLPNKMELSTNSSGCHKQIGNKVQANTSKASLVRVVKPSFLPKSHISSIPETRKGGIPSTFVLEIPSKPTSKKVENTPTATSGRVKTHPKSTAQMVKTSSEFISKMKRTSPKESSFEDKEMELSEMHVSSLNPDSIKMKTMSSMNSPKGVGGERNSKIEMKKREDSSKPCREVGSVSARKHKGLKIVSRLANQPKPIKVELEEQNNEAEEKTLYVIKMESANKTSQSDQNESQDIGLLIPNSLSLPSEDQEESEYPTSEFEEDASSGNHEIESSARVETLVIEENGKPQKDGVVLSEDKDYQKLSGRGAETQTENASDVKAGTITIPEKVLLRHQDVQFKKDGRGLYNKVIKETANKLVAVRKSKVQALVGAFETVISLEEKSTSANYVN